MPFGEGAQVGHRRDVCNGRVNRDYRALCGTEISASQVSRISAAGPNSQFRNRPLGSYPVVYLVRTTRGQGSIQDVAVLKATGVNCWGKREVIGVSCRLSEAEVHWRGFLQQLQKRGLEGVQLIVSDDHSGLRAARRAVFPSVATLSVSPEPECSALRPPIRRPSPLNSRHLPSGGEGEAMLRTSSPARIRRQLRHREVGWEAAEGEPPVCRRRTRFGSEGTASLLGNGEARMEGKPDTDKSLMGNVKKASC